MSLKKEYLNQQKESMATLKKNLKSLKEKKAKFLGDEYDEDIKTEILKKDEGENMNFVILNLCYL